MREATTVLHTRSDWAFIRFAYIPAIIAVAIAIKFLWAVGAAAAVKIRIAPCGLCACLAMWGHHFEEWLNAKPLMSIQTWGITYENGGEIKEIEWDRIRAVVFRRRIPPWRTSGDPGLGPPYWMIIEVDQGDDSFVLSIWPRAVDGGLMRLYRFGREMQKRLHANAAALDSAGEGASLPA